MIPAKNVRAGTLNQAEVGDVFWSQGDDMDRWLLVSVNGEPHAVGLEGQNLGRAFDAQNAEWPGLFVSGGIFEIDPATATRDGDEAGTLWLGTSGLTMRVKKHGIAFGGTFTAPIGEQSGPIRSGGMAIMKWRIVLDLGGGRSHVLFSGPEAE